MTQIAIFIALIFFCNLISARFERSVVAPPIHFTVAGMTTVNFTKATGSCSPLPPRLATVDLAQIEPAK